MAYLIFLWIGSLVWFRSVVVLSTVMPPGAVVTSGAGLACKVLFCLIHRSLGVEDRNAGVS